MDEPTPGLAGTLAGGAPLPMAGTSTTTMTSAALNNTNTFTTATTTTTSAPAGGGGGGGGGGATVVQLQQRRKAHYFFRTISSMGTDAGGGWPGAESGAGTPRSAVAGDVAGYAAGEGLRQLAWSLAVNGALALLLLGLVEAVVLPVLIASLELTPAPHVSKLLTALLTAHLFQVGARGTVVLLLAVGGSALGLLLTGAWDRGFVPLFLAWYVGLDTLARVVVGSNGGGSGGGYSGLPSTSSSSALGLGGGPLKTLSETSSARERGWSPVGRWRLWGA